jgi:hypothetical protein
VPSAAEGGFDLTESPAVRETRLLIAQKRLKAEQDAKEAEELKEKRKLQIMQKIMREEGSRRKKEKKEKQEKKVCKALESLAPNPGHAFPFETELANTEYKVRKQERSRAAEYFDVEDVIRKIPSEVDLLETRTITYGTLSNADKKKEEDGATQQNESVEKLSRPRLPPPRHKIIPKKESPNHHSNSLTNNTLPASITLPFTAEPPRVIFKDYDPMKTYTATVVFTNTSCRVNTFKSLPVPVEIASFFEVVASPPGRMSAGMTTEINIVFRPPAGYDQDILDGRVKFQAEFGGEFFVEVGCAARKCCPRVGAVGGKGVLTKKFAASEALVADAPVIDETEEREADRAGSDICSVGVGSSLGGGWSSCVAKLIGKRKVLVDFGACVLGDVISRTVEIVNDGALATRFDVYEITDENVEGTLSETLIQTSENLDEKQNMVTNLNLPKGAAINGPSRPSSVISHTFDKFNTTTPVFKVTKNQSSNLGGYSSQTVHICFAPPYNIIKPTKAPTASGSTDPRTPLRQLPERRLYKIQFHFPNADPLILDCRAKSIEPPLNIDTEELDFQLCAIGSSYRECVKIHNRSNIALKFWVEIQGYENVNSSAEPFLRNQSPGAYSKTTAMSQWGDDSMVADDGLDGQNVASAAESENVRSQNENSVQFASSVHVDGLGENGKKLVTLKASKRSDSLRVEVPIIGEVEVSPRLAFVQPHDSFSVWIKIKPTRSAWLMLKNGEEPFHVPIIIKYINQGVVSPIPFNITGMLTTTDVSFLLPNGGSSELNFGACNIYERKEVPIRIWNQSKFPQVAKFITSDPALTIIHKPFEDLHGGIIPLPPMSHLTRYVKFEPTAPGDFEIKMICHTIWDRKFELVCRGIGTVPPLKLEYSEIKFTPTAMGSLLSTKIKLFRDRLEQRSWSANKNKTRTVVKGSSNDKIRNINKQKDGNLVQSSKKKATSALLSFNELYEDQDVDLIGFEFGPAKIIKIITQSDMIKNDEEMQAVAKQVIKDCKQNIIDAQQAVQRADQSLDKVFKKTVFSSSSTASAKIIQQSKRQDGFRATDIILQNNRIMVPTTAPELINRSHATPAYHLKDEAPVLVTPQSGELRPGASISLDINLSPAAINNLTVSSIIRERMAAAEAAEKSRKDVEAAATQEADEQVAAAAAAQTAKAKHPNSGGKKKGKDEMQRPLGSAGSTIEAPAAPKVDWKSLFLQNSSEMSGSNNRRQRPKNADLYDVVDNTSVTMLIPCKVRRVNTERLKAKLHGPPTPTSGLPSDTIFLQVIAPIVRPDFIIVDQQSFELNYGRVPVGLKSVKSFLLYNYSSEKVEIKATNLAATGAYELLESIPTLAPGEFYEANIRFHPTNAALVSTKFELQTSTTHIALQLSGEGVIPEIDIEPAEKYLHLGDVTIGDTSSRTFTVINKSPFPVTCDLRLSSLLSSSPTLDSSPSTHGTINFSMLNSFNVFPWHATIETGNRQEFTVKFSPDRESDLYYENLILNVLGANEEHTIKLHGRCWDTTTALIGYDQPPETLRESRTTMTPKFEFDWAQKVYSGDIQYETPTSIPAIDVAGSEEDLTGVGNSGGPPGSAGAGDGKDKSKDKKKDIAAIGSTLSEDLIADVLRITPRVHTRFVTLSCPWVNDSSTGKWKVDAKELSIANLKPNNFVKPETKKPPMADFTIEPYHGTFEYVDEVHGFVQLPPPKPKMADSMLKFTVEPTKGSLDVGNSKTMKVSLVNPVKEFSAAIQKIQDSIAQNQSAGGGKHTTAETKITNAVDHNSSASQPSDSVDLEFDAPVRVESYFKVVLKGGLRLVEPKGVPGPAESRTWILKVTAELPDSV